ncbi:unnamed protein product [Vicia faba]|uniref:Uncharacterized protein n=1 Tax=Vicia faba TaxID=3906 RepID=A0AAV0ZMH2_VICFA|nr:unnamed protein product [Vicia faba]
MNFNKSKHFVTNKGKEDLMKKAISKEEIESLQVLGVDKADMYEEERKTKMLEQMFQNHTQESKLSHEDCFIKWNDDGQDEGPPNVEQPLVVQKKLEKNSNYAKASLLKSSHKIYVSDNSLNIPIFDKSGIFASGSMNVVPLRVVSMRKNHDEYYQRTNLRNPDGDKEVANILYDMLTKPRVYKENEDHIHEDVEVDSAIVGGVKYEGVISKNENILLDCVVNNNKLRVISKKTQSMDDMPPQNHED